MTFRQSIEAISFDIDHTLIDFDAVLRNSLSKVSELLNDDFSVAVSVQDLILACDEAERVFEGEKTDYLAIRKQSFFDVLSSNGLAELHTEKLFETFIKERFRTTIFMPGAEELLSSLQERLKISVLSNGNSHPERLGFAHYFDRILLGKDLNYKKPHVGAFLHLQKELGISDPSKIIHVGDSRVDDVKGAKGAGFQSVWFNPSGEVHSDLTQHDHEIASLMELVPLIEEHYDLNA